MLVSVLFCLVNSSSAELASLRNRVIGVGIWNDASFGWSLWNCKQLSSGCIHLTLSLGGPEDGVAGNLLKDWSKKEVEIFLKVCSVSAGKTLQSVPVQVWIWKRAALVHKIVHSRKELIEIILKSLGRSFLQAFARLSAISCLI